jgi:folate-binding protein YgfZ
MDPTPTAGSYEAARERAAWLDRRSRGRIVVSGRDRATYLHSLLTNDIVALKAGAGCYSAYLTPQGRMITDLWVYELGDVILIELGQDTKDTLLAKLDQFVFSEDVQLGDVTEAFGAVAVVGPQASQVVSELLETVTKPALDALPDHGNLRATFGGQPAIVLRVSDTGQPGYEVVIDRAAYDECSARLIAAGIPQLDGATAAAIRIEDGVPLFGQDMDEETIPLEAGIEGRAISLTKGCYVGQEVIIRVLHRGHGRVARHLVGLSIDSDRVPAAGATLTSADKEIGRVTSAAWSPALGRPVGLGYVHRDYAAPGTAISVDGRAATVAPLPLVRPAS